MKLTAAEKAEMILTAEDTFNDTCTIHQSTGTSQNTFGDVTHTYTDIADVACGLSFPGDRAFQAEIGQAVVLQVDALLRVSLEQDLSIEDEVTARSERYAVDGIHDGSTVRIAWLKRMATEE